jgi:hypothetical protein
MARSHAPGGAENETKTARSAPEVRLDAPLDFHLKHHVFESRDVPHGNLRAMNELPGAFDEDVKNSGDGA